MSYVNPTDVDELVSVLEKGSAKNIWFQEVDINTEAAVRISNALASSSSVSYLRLVENNLGDKGLEILSEGIRENESLQHLDISNNEIGNAGLTALAQALQANMTLKNLEIVENHIDDDGAGVMSRLLENNTTLSKLKIGLNGASLLLKAFDSNTTLVNLKYLRRRINSSSGEWRQLKGNIAEALERNKRIQAERKKKAFDDAKNSIDITGPWHRCKLMIIGEGGVGKTATVRALVGEEFLEEWDSTVGVSLTQSKTSTWQNIPFSVEAGGYTQEFAADRAHELLKDEQLRKNTTLEEAWLMGYRASKLGKPLNNPFKRKDQLKQIDAKKLLNKVAVDQEKTNKTERKKPNARLIKMFGKFVDDAEKDDGISLTIWDYGGQDVFHALHHLFLTQYGVYVFVFDVRSILQRSEETNRSIRFWLNSVHMHADEAHVIPVGTFKNEITEDELKEVSKIFQELTKAYNQLIKNESLSFFPVDNKNSEGIIELKVAIRQATLSLEFVNREVSINWIRTLDSMKWAARNKNWISLKEAGKIAREHYISSADELNRMLAFFHELGVLIHFTKTQALNDVITLYPQWLVTEFAKLIRDAELHKFDMVEIRKVELVEEVQRLFLHGLASYDLLEYMWSKETVDFLVDLMKNLALASDYKFGNRETLYFIPSMAANQMNNLEEPHGVKAVFDFSKFYLPDGVYERLLCGCVEHSSSVGNMKEPKIGKNVSNFWFDKTAPIHLIKSEETISANVELNSSPSFVLQFLIAQLNQIKRDLMKNLKWTIQLEVNGSLYTYEDAKRNSFDPWFTSTGPGTKPVSGKTLEAFGME